MIKFTELLERAKSEKIAIHTPTEEQAITLLSELDKKGYEWFGGEEITTTRYKMFSESTCYVFGIDVYGNVLDKKIMYDSLSFFLEMEYTIIEFTNIDFKKNA